VQSKALVCAAVLALVACSSSDTPAGSATPDGGKGNGPAGGDSPNGNAPGGSVTPPGGSSPGATAPDDGLIPADSIWRTKSEWFRAIDDAPAADHSAEMIGALKQWGDTGDFQIDFSFNVVEATNPTPVTFPNDDEGDNVPVPMPAKGYVEGDNAYDACPEGEDCHMLIFDSPKKKLYELYHVHENGGDWQGYVALWQLDKAYPRSNRGQGCTSADAAGLAITPGLIGYRETKKGTIAHALRFIIKNDYIHGNADKKNPLPNVVYPASHGSTSGASANGIPYGGRLRLKASVLDTDPRIKTAGAKAVVQALHKYGMILADGGNLPLVAESARVYHDSDPSATWDGILGPRDLVWIKPTDFEVVGIPKDVPGGGPGWYSTKAEYEAQLQKPLGCDVIVQP
jgi:serine/threonine-protein kinase